MQTKIYLDLEILQQLMYCNWTTPISGDTVAPIGGITLGQCKIW